MEHVREVLRAKAEAAKDKPGGHVYVLPLDLIAILDDLDTLERLRDLVLAQPRAVSCPNCGASLDNR